MKGLMCEKTALSWVMIYCQLVNKPQKDQIIRKSMEPNVITGLQWVKL